MITIRGLKKRFRGTDVLHGVDIDVPTGKVTAFLGPNGAGKTTTIKCAMNLLERDTGSIEVLGCDPRALKPEHWQRIALRLGKPEDARLDDRPATARLRTPDVWQALGPRLHRGS